MFPIFYRRTGGMKDTNFVLNHILFTKHLN